jgi:hypothetical protein
VGGDVEDRLGSRPGCDAPVFSSHAPDE